MSSLAIGVDIGGTKVAAGLVDDSGHVLRRAQAATPSQELGAGAVEDAIVEVVREVMASEPVAGVGIGAAGLVRDGAVLYCPHLPLRGEPVAERIAERLERRVVIDNDATAAALGESRFGAARGAAVALCVNLGTGIGGAAVVDGVVQRGAHGLAGEFGHLTLVPDGIPCECGRLGCWEQYASGRALQRLLPGHAGVEITALAGQGDPAAVAAFTQIGSYLGRGLATLVAAYDPDRIVVGGGVGAAGELLLAPARIALAESVFAAAWRPEVPVVSAALGADSGLIGAAALALAA